MMESCFEDEKYSSQLSNGGNAILGDGVSNVDYFEVENEDIEADNKEESDLNPSDGKEVLKIRRNEKSRILWGLLVVIFMSFAMTGSTQFVKSTYSKSFRGPFFTTWYFASCLSIIYPLALVLDIFKNGKKNLKYYHRENLKFFGADGFSFKSYLKCSFVFCCMYVGGNYAYMLALDFVHGAVVSAVFSSNSALVYILSFIVLKDKFYFCRVLAVLLSIGGLVLMASSGNFEGSNSSGIASAATAAIVTAFFTVFYKRTVGDATGGQVALFLSLIGLGAFAFFWTVFLALYYSSQERIQWQHVPWIYLNANAACQLIFTFLMHFGMAFTYPLFITVGMVIAIPLNGIIDVVFRGADFGSLKIVAAAMIALSFILMLIPIEFLDRIEPKMACINRKKDGSDGKEKQHDILLDHHS